MSADKRSSGRAEATGDVLARVLGLHAVDDSDPWTPPELLF